MGEATAPTIRAQRNQEPGPPSYPRMYCGFMLLSHGWVQPSLPPLGLHDSQQHSLPALPRSFLEEVFLRMVSDDAKLVARNVMLVCKEWNEVATAPRVWENVSVRLSQAYHALPRYAHHVTLARRGPVGFCYSLRQWNRTRLHAPPVKTLRLAEAATFFLLGDVNRFTAVLTHHLTNLQRLNLGSLESTKAEDITVVAELTTLTELSAVNTGLGVRVPDGLKRLSTLTGLRRLDVSYNNFSAPDTFEVATFCNLECLSLAECSIKAVSVEKLSSLTALTSLNLANNPIKDGVEHLSSLTGLRELKLASCTLGTWGDPQLSVLGSLAALTSLDVSGTWLHHKTIPQLALLDSLHTLIAANNSLGDASVREYGPLHPIHLLSCIPSLKCLDIRSNSFWHAPSAGAALAQLTGLERLWASGNSFGPEGKQHLAKCLSGLTGLSILNL